MRLQIFRQIIVYTLTVLLGFGPTATVTMAQTTNASSCPAGQTRIGNDCVISITDVLIGTQPTCKEGERLGKDFSCVPATPALGRATGSAAQNIGWVDAALHIKNSTYYPEGETYLFQGDRYFRMHGTKLLATGQLSSLGSLSSLAGRGDFYKGIDAAFFADRSQKIYMFRGNQYIRLTKAFTVEAGYPKSLPGGWRGMPADFAQGIDAAIYYGGRSYLFKGDRYIRFTGTGKDLGYPQRLPGGWSLIDGFKANLGAAVQDKVTGFSYFFKGFQNVRLRGIKRDSLTAMSLPNEWTGLVQPGAQAGVGLTRTLPPGAINPTPASPGGAGASYPTPVAGVAYAQNCPTNLNEPRDNWMIEMWPARLTVSSKDLLVQAAVAQLKARGGAVNDQALQMLVTNIKKDPVARYEFAPYMLGVFFKALGAKSPTAAQNKYKSYFQTHQSCQDYFRATQTLKAWKTYQGEGRLSTKAYSPVLLSQVNFNQAPSVAGFLESDPLSFGEKGGAAVALLYLPMAAKAGIFDNHPLTPHIAKMGEEMTAVAVGAGLGTAAGSAAAIFAPVMAFTTVAVAKFSTATAAALSLPAALTAAKASLAAGIASGASHTVLFGLKQAVITAQGAITSAGSTASSAAGSSMSMSAGLLAGPIIVVTIAAAILGVTAAEVAKKAAYEAKVRKAAANFSYFNVDQFLSGSASKLKVRRTALFTLMVKQLVGDPAEYRGLTLAVPPITSKLVSATASTPAAGTSAASATNTFPPAGGGYQRIQNSWNRQHYIHNQSGNLGIGEIDKGWNSAMWKIIPVHSGWVRIQNRWNPDRYIHNQNGKLEVGTIDKNWSSAMWKIVPVHSGWVRIQNSWYREHYIHNQNGKLEVGPIDNNWSSALWHVE